jgi:hypothetical protein
MSRIRASLFAAMLGIAGVTAVAPPAHAAVGLENFTMVGTLSCTNQYCTAFQGTTGTCLETEAEPGDTVVARPCSAHFTATIARTCEAGACVFTGVAYFYFADASESGLTIGPVPAQIAGVVPYETTTGVERVQAGALAGVFAAADVYTANPALVWAGSGAFGRSCISGSGLVAFTGCTNAGAVWTATLTGVEAP